MKTMVVNLYAGPGAGKTTGAWEIAALLKKEKVNTEYVAEYAKELVWDNQVKLLDGSVKNQTHLFKVQSHRLARLKEKVSIIVTDSPFCSTSYTVKTLPLSLRKWCCPNTISTITSTYSFAEEMTTKNPEEYRLWKKASKLTAE